MTTTQGFGSVSRRVLLGSGIGGAGLLATGCSVFGDEGGETGGDGTGADGPVVNIGSIRNIDNLDPHYVNASRSILTAGLMEGLVLQDQNGTDVVPALAESWDVSEDELTYTFHLREGAVWSNGDPITSADVIWSFERLLSPTGASAGGTTGSTSYQPSMGIRGADGFRAGTLESWDEVGISAPDDATVVIELESPNPDFLLNMTHHSMTVLHQASIEADAQGWQQPENWVGNGPYLLAAWDPTTLIEMEKNPDYWDAGNVGVQKISQQLGGDLPTRVLAFQEGGVDLLEVIGSSLIGAPELEDALSRTDGTGTHHLQVMWGGHPAIQDQRVRRALSMAIDREALVANDPGLEPAGSLIPNSVPGWREELVVPYDVDGARALLEEAGVADSPPGLRILAGLDAPMLEILREGIIDALGMDVMIEVVEAGVYSEMVKQPAEDDSYMSFYYGSFGGVSTMPTWTLNLWGPDHVREVSMPFEAVEDIQAAQADESLTVAEITARTEEILSTQSTPEARDYAHMINEATSIIDDEERNQAFIEAALLREELSYNIPLGWSSYMFVTSDRIDGLQLRASPERFYFKHLTVNE